MRIVSHGAVRYNLNEKSVFFFWSPAAARTSSSELSAFLVVSGQLFLESQLRGKIKSGPLSNKGKCLISNGARTT